MENPRPPLTAEAQTAVSMVVATVVAGAFGMSLFVAGGSVPVLVVTLVLTLTSGSFALHNWRHAKRHGWRTFTDDEGEDWPGGGGPKRPVEPEGPPGGTQVDWDQFTSEFWAHVSSRERVPA